MNGLQIFRKTFGILQTCKGIGSPIKLVSFIARSTHHRSLFMPFPFVPYDLLTPWMTFCRAPKTSSCPFFSAMFSRNLCSIIRAATHGSPNSKRTHRKRVQRNKLLRNLVENEITSTFQVQNRHRQHGKVDFNLMESHLLRKKRKLAGVNMMVLFSFLNADVRF